MPLFRKKENPAEKKVGRVRKCPQCGAAVPASKVICPECGWEFDDVADRQSALQRLTAQLGKTHGFFSSKSAADVVRDFAIPKSKGDLLELTIFFKARSSAREKSDQYGLNEGFEFRKECRLKYEECIMKARQFYYSDKDFARLIEDYDKAIKNKKNLIVFLSILGVAIIAGVVLLIVL